MSVWSRLIPLACWSVWIMAKNPMSRADISPMMSSTDSRAIPESSWPRRRRSRTAFRPVTDVRCWFPVVSFIVMPFIAGAAAYR